MRKNGQRKYKYFFMGRGKSYYKHSNSAKKFSETVTINMLEFLIDNIFVLFDGRVLLKTVGISMSTNCTLLLAGLFLYSHKANFIQGLRNENERKIARSIL